MLTLKASDDFSNDPRSSGHRLNQTRAPVRLRRANRLLILLPTVTSEEAASLAQRATTLLNSAETVGPKYPSSNRLDRKRLKGMKKSCTRLCEASCSA